MLDRKGKVLRVLLSGRCLPRNQAWLNFWETRLLTVRKSLHRSCWTELTCQGIFSERRLMHLVPAPAVRLMKRQVFIVPQFMMSASMRSSDLWISRHVISSSSLLIIDSCSLSSIYYPFEWRDGWIPEFISEILAAVNLSFSFRTPSITRRNPLSCSSSKIPYDLLEEINKGS